MNRSRAISAAFMARALPAVFSLLLAAGPSPAMADMSRACHVPDALLVFDARLTRISRLVDHSQPVRILRIRAFQDGPEAKTLNSELAHRLPDVRFTIIEEYPQPGDAEDDFAQIRTAIDETDPDLVIWQLGTGDALASTDLDSFSQTLGHAADWIERRDVDLVLVDPPFVPNVAHERLYRRISAWIDAISRRERMNVVNQYDATHYLLSKRTAATPTTSPSALPSPAPARPHCMTELMAEAIVRAATR
ncbi:hypothetical protein ACT6QH_02590 [Xanthobacter sp. TB0139]|uniref:hypothetical protein n=1 Tax=Xanthobacter sp. TB0139 TaxID=3459178 RepID=UPI004039A8BD